MIKMNKKIVCLLALFAIWTTVPAWATHRVEELTLQNPSASPYEILKKLFDESKQPAQITDIDLATDATSQQLCVLAGPDSERPLSGYVQRWVLTEPGHGPLFPQSEKMVIEANRSGRAAGGSLLNGLSYAFSVYQTSTELVEEIKKSDYPASPVTIRLRRNGGLVAIQYIAQVGTPSETTVYSYCYR
jgi:hypothetical protein